MFGVKSVDSIVKQFTSMLVDLDVIISHDTTTIQKVDEQVLELNADKAGAQLNQQRAEKIQKNILALIN